MNFMLPGFSDFELNPISVRKKRGPDQCFEKCVNDHMASPAPDYDVGAGRPWMFPKAGAQQCQVYASSVLDQCAAKCRK